MPSLLLITLSIDQGASSSESHASEAGHLKKYSLTGLSRQQMDLAGHSCLGSYRNTPLRYLQP